MKLFRYLLPMFVVCAMTSVSAAEVSERDTLGVEKFIKTKRAMTVEEKAGELRIAGDVRVETQFKNSKLDGSRINGTGSAKKSNQHRSELEMDVEANLYIDYRTDDTWAHMTLEFDNNFGLSDTASVYVTDVATGNLQTQGSGGYDAIKLEKAFFGMNVWDNGNCRLDVELGRRPLYSIFDSRIQFYSNFDGLLLRYSRSFDDIGDFYFNCGQFLIDSNFYHFGYVGELGLLNISDLGLDVKYSYISHRKKGTSGHTATGNIQDNGGFRFRNSQISLAYHLDPEILGYEVTFYGAFLHNHAAERSGAYSKKRNEAWYLGARYGKLKKAGDIALDINYQRVENQAVASHDVSGVSTGNWKKTSPRNNYKGWLAELGYNVTDNVNVVLEYERSGDVDADFPDAHSHRYSKLELEIKYAF